MKTVFQLFAATTEVALYVLMAAAALHLVGQALWARRRGRVAMPTASITSISLPLVTVQLPLCNELEMVEPLLRSVAALRWPTRLLQIQVLDDSDDETSAQIDWIVADLHAEGHDIEALRRGDRAGFKAGNLAHGLAHARGEFIFVLDADFRPAPDLLVALHARLAANPTLAFVQARWTYRNERGVLMQLQAAILDGLFSIEQPRLSEGAQPVQFNGTGGLWRRTAIERAGGWRVAGDALTEDLDLSLRAREAGLRGITCAELVVSTELPSTMGSFRTQQARWVRGGALALRALGLRLLRQHGEAKIVLAHLARHARQPLFTAAIARLPLVAFGWAAPLAPSWLGPMVIGATIAATGAYLAAARVRVGRGFIGGFCLAPSLAALSVGLAPTLTAAFVGGLLGKKSSGFLRTPKGSDVRREKYEVPIGSIMLTLGSIAAAIGFAQQRDFIAAVTAALVAGSLTWVALP